jgi:hypothetical protein
MSRKNSTFRLSAFETAASSISRIKERPSNEELEAGIRMCLEPMFELSEDPNEQESTFLDISLASLKEFWQYRKKLFAEMIGIAYIHAIIKRKTGHFLDRGARVFHIRQIYVRMIQNEALQTMKGAAPDTIEYFILSHTFQLCKEILNILKTLTPEYLQEKTHSMVEIIREDLMRAAWHPSRVKWWMSEDEKLELNM